MDGCSFEKTGCNFLHASSLINETEAPGSNSIGRFWSFTAILSTMGGILQLETLKSMCVSHTDSLVSPI